MSTDDIDIVHIRSLDGRCVISLNGQGHLPCSTHPRLLHAMSGMSDFRCICGWGPVGVSESDLREHIATEQAEL